MAGERGKRRTSAALKRCWDEGGYPQFFLDGLDNLGFTNQFSLVVVTASRSNVCQIKENEAPSQDVCNVVINVTSLKWVPTLIVAQKKQASRIG